MGAPLGWFCKARRQVAIVGTAEIEETMTVEYAARSRARICLRSDSKSKRTLTKVSAMGKWTIATCCACLARRTDFRSNGFIWVSLHYCTTILAVIFGWIAQ